MPEDAGMGRDRRVPSGRMGLGQPPFAESNPFLDRMIFIFPAPFPKNSADQAFRPTGAACLCAYFPSRACLRWIRDKISSRVPSKPR